MLRPDATGPADRRPGLPANPEPFLMPDWLVGAALSSRVQAVMSTRAGGVGVAPFDSLNLAQNPSDPAVAENRRRFAQALGAEPRWLHQVHGATVVRVDERPWGASPQADAAVTRVPGQGCVVFAADCLPVLFCAAGGVAVGAAHAGWRGLAAGVLPATVRALCDEAGCGPADVQAWLGPCIGPRQFEVGADVLQAFGQDTGSPDAALWRRQDRADGSPRWRADLAGLARRQLLALGLAGVGGGHWCTVEDSAFFSFRRDGRHGPTGRMAAGICIRA